MWIGLEGQVDPLKLILLDGRVPKGSDDPALLPIGTPVLVEYKKIFHHIISFKAIPGEPLAGE